MKKLMVVICAASFLAIADEFATPEVVETAPVVVEETAPVVEEVAPVAVEEVAPVAVEEVAPVAVEEVAPVAVEEPAPVAVEEVAPVAVVEAAPVTEQPVEASTASEPVDNLFWGFGNYGLYSGYQLYGSLLNPEPTLQGYLEGNVNLTCDDTNFGYLGVGVWSNTDLTDRRRASYGKAFNEWDFNIHWGKTFWFDDDQSIGLDYRTSIVWYYYPHRRHHKMNGSQFTTMDWNHSFALVNPFLTPFLDWVHEYHESNADLLQFGVRRTFAVTDEFTLTPAVVFVYRDHRYKWCFPTAGFHEFHNGGIATAKLQLDANYQLTENFGLFAKAAYASLVDKDLRDASDHSHGADYGKYKDIFWCGVGVTVNF